MTNETKVVEKVKLSELPDETLVSYEDAHFKLTAEELRQCVANGEHEGRGEIWIVATEKRWAPDAKWMLSNYIENEYDQMYEDWDERANDCIKKEHIDRIQAVLDDAFSGDSVSKYWLLDGPVVDLLS
ncbi:MAG TPA: hypothetical protein IAA29_00630 [Candidatus Paenibacillus intestinavium]|nr:hypothetical protein [Candidatus Paenibacillus intestinavium]